MQFERLGGYTVTSDQMRKWFFGGHTNASKDREREITDMFRGITWVRKDAGSNLGSPAYIDPIHINPDYPFYWVTAHGTKQWQVYMNPNRQDPAGPMEHHEFPDLRETWTMREIDGQNYGWSLAIYPARVIFTSINWETAHMQATMDYSRYKFEKLFGSVTHKHK